MIAPSALSGVRRRQSPAGLLHAGQARLGLGQRTRPHIDARRLGRDLDRLARRRITAHPRFLRRLDANRQLHQTPDPHLLRITQLGQHHLLKRAEHPLGASARDLSAVRQRGRQLNLGQRHTNSLGRTTQAITGAFNPPRRTTTPTLSSSRSAQLVAYAALGYRSTLIGWPTWTGVDVRDQSALSPVLAGPRPRSKHNGVLTGMTVTHVAASVGAFLSTQARVARGRTGALDPGGGCRLPSDPAAPVARSSRPAPAARVSSL